ncbi:DUF3592 domain-containing protein [Streptomyces sp. NPDC048257]|uniref:DUF3592 domain-containing protein n=1 Tax=Streptomyces sp. NPDC048257 TaxID=3365526 RepID=UPI0037143813
MDWHGFLLLWCAVCGVWALFGYGRSLIGATPAQRAVRVTGRIVEVRTPAHGNPGTDGIPVVIAFPDPATGREHALPYEAERGITLDTVWLGQEVAVLHPPGEPHRFEVTYDLQDGRHGRGWPHFAVFLLYAGLVADTALRHGYPWALLGAGGPLAVAMTSVLRHDLVLMRREAARLATAVRVPGRVAAVLESVHEDGEGSWTSHTAVLVFTTREGTAVTARLRSGIPDPAHAYGRELTVHYVPDDLALFTLDPAAARRSARWDIAFVVLVLLLGAAAAVAGAVLLWGQGADVTAAGR